MSGLASSEDQQEWICRAAEDLLSIACAFFSPQISSATAQWAECPLVVGLHWMCSRSTLYKVISAVDSLVYVFHNVNQNIASEEEQGGCLRNALRIQIKTNKQANKQTHTTTVNTPLIKATSKINLIHIFMVSFDCKALYVMMSVVSSRPLLTNSTLHCRNILITF